MISSIIKSTIFGRILVIFHCEGLFLTEIRSFLGNRNGENNHFFNQLRQKRPQKMKKLFIWRTLKMYCTNVKWRILEPEDILLSRIHIQNTLNPVSGLVYCIVQILYIINYYVIKWSNFATHSINKTPLDATRRHTSRAQSFFRKNKKTGANLLKVKTSSKFHSQFSPRDL